MNIFTIITIDLLFGIFMIDGLSNFLKPNIYEILVINIPTYFIVVLLLYYKLKYIVNSITVISILFIKNIFMVLFYYYV